MKYAITHLILLLLLTVAGCVGTVQEVTPPGSLQLKNPTTTFSFPGITTARAISHNKVELEFFPASGSEIVYKLYVNNAVNPITIDTKTLRNAGGGKLLYTVDDLVADREYKFKLTAFDLKTNAFSTNENEAFARTFDNVVSDFDGIAKISLVPGSTSSAIKVDWIVPAMSGIFTAGPYDPVRYEVTVISSIGGLGNLNNPNYFGTDRKVELVPKPPAPAATPLDNPRTVEIPGLAADTQYYVQVRAINALYESFQNDPDTVIIPVSREMNTRFLTIKTDPPGSLFDFRQDNVILKNAKGADSFNKIEVFWQPGSGSFTAYRIFVRKYDGLGDPNLDDKLSEANLHSMNISSNFKTVPPTKTSQTVDSLENGAWYQVKVALCKTLTCPVQSSDPNAALVSDLRAIRVQPSLAAFGGINTIEHPGQFSQKNVVNLKFDAPIVNDGFANALEFYCVDPAQQDQMVKLTTTPLSGSSITKCNGLFLDGTSPLSTYTNQKIKGLITDGLTEYCFAATPAILGYGPEIRLSPANRIIRCIYPEVLPPTVGQFPGLSNTCDVSGVTAYVKWSIPTGGIYSGFRVFWREKSTSAKFSFPHAIDNSNTDYFRSIELSASSTDYVATGLIPGRTYQIGVLAKVNMDLPIPDLYSEYNLNIRECVVPLPVATFKGFTRIFAVGPKMDGRAPNDKLTGAPPVSGLDNALIFEAINQEGIPYEVAMDSFNSPNISANFTPPPGRDYGASFGSGFDGATDTEFGISASRNGIVSLAWEDVDMNFPEATAMFNDPANQPPPPAVRGGRKWGYKVFRSHDNKLTWKELTAVNGQVYSIDYTYYKRPDVASTTSRMAFFTDYSVKALHEVHDASKAMDVERARTYYYKIVPVFDGQNLSYSAGNHNIVRVTLPPPNMALVHRWMANRTRCMEIDKPFSIANDYSCTYNGVGSRPKSVPHRVGDTALDQGGDLLVDRFELGCRYTRGEKTDSPENGFSNFSLPDSAKRPGDWSIFPLFRGFSTQFAVENTSSPFRGCTGINLPNNSLDPYPAGFAPEFQRYLQGDCMGGHSDRIASSSCTALNYSLGRYYQIIINIPGAQDSPDVEDCSAGGPLPMDAISRYSGPWAPNLVMQSEFLAVYYNTNLPSMTGSAQFHGEFRGPNVGDLSTSRMLNNNNINNGLGSSSCSINLAAIGNDGYMKPRWTSINEMSLKRMLFKGTRDVLIDKTVDQLTEVAASTTEPLTFYNGREDDGTTAAFKLPKDELRVSSRYKGTSRIGRIMTSNSAKLPPIGRLSPEAAESLCGTYYIQTGIASDSGTFSPDSPVKQKRLLRKPESITANVWPETFNTVKVDEVEKSALAGSCVNAYKNVTGSPIDRGQLIRNTMPVTSSLADSTLVTGSSRYNRLVTYNEGFHSDRCVSRYGIQDMIGNVSENNSERIFCDYSQDRINLGPTTIDARGNAAANIGAGGPDYAFFNNSSERSDWHVLKSATNSLNQAVQFEFRYLDGTPTRSDIRPWVNISTDSGYCSVVDGNPAKRSSMTNFFRDVSSGYWTQIYAPGGIVNSTIIERTQTDQDSVKAWRNGDGRFLDFGPQGIGAPINTANSLALSGVTAKSKYFNPIIGLPLQCSNFSCNDTALSPNFDNTLITLPGLESNIVTGVDDDPLEDDFYIGNSAITNVGISDYTYSSEASQTITVPADGSSAGLSIGPVLSAVTFADPSLASPVREVMSFPGDFQPGSEFKYYRVIWGVERGADFAFDSGGGSTEAATGRYTTSLGVSAVGASPYGSNDSTRGARCAIMINEE